MTDHLIAAHGGTLIDLITDPATARDLVAQSASFASWDMTERQLCDFELLANGGFSPLRGFMEAADYESVRDDMRLSDGTLWPIPITLDVTESFASAIGVGDRVALRDPEGVMLGVISVADIYRPDLDAEAEAVFGADSREHPGVAYLTQRSHPVYLGGPVVCVERPRHYDYTELRLTPAELRQRFAHLGWRKIVAFQTRNPMHRAHQELTLRAAKEVEANLLIHPVVGMTKPGDVDHFTRVRCYQAILDRYPANTAALSLLPLAMRMAGPREALWHAIIRKNYGCTHLIVGRDHAGPGVDSSGEPFYGPYDAQELLSKFAGEIGVEMVPFKMMVYVPSRDCYEPIDEIAEGTETASISGTELRHRLAKGAEIPDWFTYSGVAAELARSYPPRSQQGFTVFFTGLSGSGKSTIANVLITKLHEMGGRPITLLDGDLVRKNLSSELGFSKEHRDINIRRIGWVAAQITRNGGIAVCAPIAPYESVRSEVREMIAPNGGFILVHVSTPIQTCEQRDRKGLYAKARQGLIKEFTGVSDPYEAPSDADVVIDTTDLSPEEAAQTVLLKIESEGFIG